MIWVIPVFFYKTCSTNRWWSATSTNPPSAQAPLITTPVPPIQLLLTTPSFGQLSAHSLPCRGPSCGTAPYPRPNLALTHWCWLKEKKSRPLRQLEGGPGPEPAGVGGRACRGGEPIHQPVTRSSLGPSPTPYRASVRGPAAQRGPRKGRGEDRRLYFVAIKDVKMELTPFGGPSAREVTHHRSQEQGLSAARTGRHGEAEGKGQPG